MTDHCRTCHQPVVRIHKGGRAMDRTGLTLAPHDCNRCPSCSGTGELLTANDSWFCPNCWGSGRVEMETA